MQYSDKWLGILGAGFSGSVLGGLSVCQAVVWNMGGSKVPMRVLVKGVRLGAVANADAGHYIVFISGVPYPNAFSEIKSKGVDWTFSLGAKGDAWLKGAGKVGSVLHKASNMPGNWAAQEVAKKTIQGAMGDFELSPKNPAFILLPTPVAVGLGVGIFYEWQTLVKQGTDIAWEYIKPSWWLHAGQNRVTLHMASIPEDEGGKIAIHITRKVFGADDILRFASKRGNDSSAVIVGVVRDGMLYDESGQLGINLTDRKIAGATEIGMLSTKRVQNNFAGQKISIAINVARSFSGVNLYKWRSKDYAAVSVDKNGSINASSDIRTKR